MILLPAIDILEGNAVRLARGDFDQRTEYDADPVDAARRWVAAGARALHVVDLDGARGGTPVNLEHVERIVREVDVPVQLGGGLRIPHIGWNDVSFERPSPLTVGLPGGACAFYHVHSLAARPADPADVIATTEYGERFATAVSHGNVFGVQFHPEKSSDAGLQILRNFLKLC